MLGLYRLVSQTLPALFNAVYSGDGNFTTSADGTDAQITSVGPAATRVLIGSSASPAVSGQAMTFTAQVVPTAPGTGIPTGTVTFSGVTCTGANPATLVNGSASCAVAAGQLLAAASRSP